MLHFRHTGLCAPFNHDASRIGLGRNMLRRLDDETTRYGVLNIEILNLGPSGRDDLSALQSLPVC
jgi:hypothetical protein